MMQKILESIYEPIFLNYSYGFRPGRGCHESIRDLKHYLDKNETQTMIDIDLQNFFGSIDQEIMEEILKEKIKDTKWMRDINRMFKTGILSEGDLRKSEEGVSQRSVVSPTLSNISSPLTMP